MTQSFSYLEPVHCSMSSSNCCFLTCIQIYQEADQVVWYSHLFQNFPQFIVIHTVKGFGIDNKAEIDVFLEHSCFFHDPADVGNLISGSSAFSFFFFFFLVSNIYLFYFFLIFFFFKFQVYTCSPPSAFSKTSLNIRRFTVTYYWSLTWRILSITLLACEISAIVW